VKKARAEPIPVDSPAASVTPKANSSVLSILFLSEGTKKPGNSCHPA
jgi:hypothetical protein